MPSHRKVWFITGASSGFGRAFAEYALERGYSVVAAARNTSRLAEIVLLAPDRVLAVALDVTDRGQVERAVTQTLARFGRVDVVVNNAGYGIVGAIEETPENELRAQMETNFFGAISITRAFLPTLREQRSGAIVNISSMGGQLSFPGYGAYSASKFALEGASEALAQEVKPFGIKVLIVEPGQFRTDFAGAALREMPVIKAYNESVGPVREFTHKMHETQEGDPRKAARAIELALDDPHTPLRLQLGEDSINAVRDHAKSMLADLEKWERVGLDTKLSRVRAPGSSH
jgi:NAD(P)-dependent dehydrogenase (short-subunit alcohol dehydrogenase family)